MPKLDIQALQEAVPKNRYFITTHAKERMGLRFLIAALGCALCREGWQIDHGPGYLWMRRGDTMINPRQLINEMGSPEFTQDKWREMLTRFELDRAMTLAPILPQQSDLRAATTRRISSD